METGYWQEFGGHGGRGYRRLLNSSVSFKDEVGKKAPGVFERFCDHPEVARLSMLGLVFLLIVCCFLN